MMWAAMGQGCLSGVKDQASNLSAQPGESFRHVIYPLCLSIGTAARAHSRRSRKAASSLSSSHAHAQEGAKVGQSIKPVPWGLCASKSMQGHCKRLGCMCCLITHCLVQGFGAQHGDHSGARMLLQPCSAQACAGGQLAGSFPGQGPGPFPPGRLHHYSWSTARVRLLSVFLSLSDKPLSKTFTSELSTRSEDSHQCAACMSRACIPPQVC